MSEEGREGQPQRYCTNCGAQTRPGNAYCVSCGAGVAPARTDGTGAQGSGADTGDASGGPSGFPGMSAFSPRAPREALRDLPRRFIEASAAKKAALGVACLLALVALAGLSALLSPVLAVAAVLVFGVSLIGLVVRTGQRLAGQRASLWGWGITAAASLVLAFASAGVSGALYSEGSAGGSGSDLEGPANGEAAYATRDELAYQQPGSPGSDIRTYTYPIGSMNADYPVPEYEVIDSSESYQYDVPSFSATISVGSLQEEDLRAVAEDIAAQSGEYDLGLVGVHEEVLEPYDPVPNSPGPLKSSVDGSTLLPSALITIELYRERYRITYAPRPFSDVVSQ